MAKKEKTTAEIYREERKARIAKAAKKNQKKSLTAGSAQKVDKIFAIVVVIAIVIGIAAFVMNNMGFIEQTRTAFKVGDQKISQAEYNYYYSNMYSRIYQYVNYGYDIGYDSSKTPDAQTYTGLMGEIKDFPEDKTPTWADFMDYTAKQNIAVMKASLLIAEEKGITLDDADRKDIEDQIQQMKETAEENNYSLGAYLKASSGKGVTKSMFKRLLEEQKIYEKVLNAKSEELKPTFTDDEVEKSFNDGIENFGVVTCRIYKVTPETVDVKDEETDEVTQEATDETKAAAKADADKLAEAKNEAEFIATVTELESNKGTKDYDVSSTLTKDADINTLYYAVYDESIATWAFTEEATVNAVKTVTNDDGSIVVVMITDPAHKPADSKTYDVRHILVKFPEDEETQDVENIEENAEETENTENAAEETTEEVKEEVSVETLDVKAYNDVTIDLNVDADSAKDKETYKKAQDILEEYLNGELTSEAFAALAEKYSEDVDSEGKINSEGGIYEDVTEGQMVPQFEKWALEKGRKAGDVGIVETTYGYHIMYFIDSKTVTWEDTVRESMAQDKLNDYQDELVADERVAVTDINEKALKNVEESIIKLAKNQIANASSQDSLY